MAHRYSNDSHNLQDWSYRPNQDLESKLESRFNMYERQIDQLFDFNYRTQDEIKILFKMKDDLGKCIDTLEKYSIDEVPQLKMCIHNYYQLELENKRRMEYIECYQFQLFIVIIIIIVYLICLRFALV
jgi:hypothetical protein